jgi:peptidoglycan/xylan/chitin deacetylase (PgdA/CDA1 family)
MDILSSQLLMKALGVVLGAGLPSAYFSPWVWRQYRMAVIRKQLRKDRVLALTYDDGPSDLTPQLLDLLYTHEVHATFFMLGRNATQYPKIADRVIEEGHQVGCHSYSHLNAWKAMPWNAIADIDSGYKQLSSWVQPDGMFRPPHGKMTLPTYWEIRRRGASIWWWTIDSQDTHEELPPANLVADTLRREEGGIVLMHDINRGQRRNDFVLESTEALLNVARQLSLKVVTLKEL